MKNLKILFAATLIGFTCFTACSKKDTNTSAFDKSYKTWQDFKASVNNSYNYVAVVTNSGTTSETRITVVKGDITARDYMLYEFQYTPSTGITTKKTLKEWHETDKNLATHGSEGAELYTLDDIYQKAQDIWLRADKGKYDVTFETNNNGMISAAGYGVRNCADDCFIGVKISSINK